MTHLLSITTSRVTLPPPAPPPPTLSVQNWSWKIPPTPTPREGPVSSPHLRVHPPPASPCEGEPLTVGSWGSLCWASQPPGREATVCQVCQVGGERGSCDNHLSFLTLRKHWSAATLHSQKFQVEREKNHKPRGLSQVQEQNKSEL